MASFLPPKPSARRGRCRQTEGLDPPSSLAIRIWSDRKSAPHYSSLLLFVTTSAFCDASSPRRVLAHHLGGIAWSPGRSWRFSCRSHEAPRRDVCPNGVRNATFSRATD